MDLAWIKAHKMLVAIFGAAAAGFILYSYLNKGSSSSSSTNAANAQYLVPEVQTGTAPVATPVATPTGPQQVAPNPTATAPSSNTTVSQATSMLQTAIQGKGASTITAVKQGGSTVGVVAQPTTAYTPRVPTPVTGLSLTPGSGAFVSTQTKSAFGTGVAVSPTSFGGATVDLPTDPTYRGYLASIGSPGNPFNYLIGEGTMPTTQIVPGIPNPTNNMIALATEGVQYN